METLKDIKKLKNRIILKSITILVILFLLIGWTSFQNFTTYNFNILVIFIVYAFLIFFITYVLFANITLVIDIGIALKNLNFLKEETHKKGYISESTFDLVVSHILKRKDLVLKVNEMARISDLEEIKKLDDFEYPIY